MASKEEKIQFILFLDPTDCQFYSHCPSKGLIAREEDVPHKIKLLAEEQIEQLKTCLDGDQPEQLTSFQRRPIPFSILSQRKFKYPVYFTEEYLPASSLQNYKVNEGSPTLKDNLNDFIKAKIYLNELQLQLQRSKKGSAPDFVTIDIKLIASVNEVIRTINRVILQDYGVVITMRNASNKLIFKVKDKSEHLYGNESIANFQFIRESLNDRRTIELEILEVSIYDKEQFLKFIFYRQIDEVNKNEYSSFPWEDLMTKQKQIEFLIWHVTDDNYTHPQTFVDFQKLFSTDELVRTNQKIKLKLEEKKRLQTKKIPRFLWKQKMSQFLDRRRAEIKNKYIELESNIIFSGECFFPFQINFLAINNLYSLFNGYSYENRILRKKFLKFQPKELPPQNTSQSRLPSLMTRQMAFAALRKNNLIDIAPYMVNIAIQFVVGSNILHSTETKYVLVDNNQTIKEQIHWNNIARLPMETCLVVKVQLYSKEGDGIICGVGAMKIFDEYGYLLQGDQEIHLFAKEKIELFKIGCIDKHHAHNPNATKLIIKLPKFKSNVIWTLTDSFCSKLLGYRPQKSQINKQDPDLERLHELLRFDALEIRKYSDKDKQLLRKSKKYYKHQSEKLLHYIFAIDWADPVQVAQSYATLGEWTAMKPLEALFLLNPAIPDEKVRFYAVKRMENMMDFQFVLYSNQITQALVSFQTHNNPLFDLILQKCVQEPYTTAVEYFWQFKNRVDQQFTDIRFRLYLQCLCMVTSFRKDLAKQVKVNNCLIEMNQNLIRETKDMKEFKDKNRKFVQILPAIEARLNQICQDGFLFPIRPQFTFKAFRQDECKMFDSKKCPFSLSCVPYKNYKGEPYKVMFKYGDDLKQDNLILQMFKVFDKLWRENGLDLKMNVYRTLSTGTELGFIELVDAQNNSKIHKDYSKQFVDAFDERTTLLFLQTYNSDNPKDFAIAKDNYLRSSAAYLVATYILGIGDRHSGNVMVQKNGKFFHIDFGHILGNFKYKLGFKREKSPVLFLSEYQYVMGGAESEDYKRFLNLCAQAFNVLRKNSFMIVNLLAMMVSADIPQLKSLQKIEYVTDKMALQLSENQAAQNIQNAVKEALMYEQSRNIDNVFHEGLHEG